MPTASTAKVTTPRKRRTRKASTTAKKSSPLNKTVAKQIVTEVIKEEVKSKPVVVNKSENVRPAQPKLTRADYVADFKLRWAIHQYEVNELGKDLRVVSDALIKQITLGSDYVRKSYNRAFN